MNECARVEKGNRRSATRAGGAARTRPSRASLLNGMNGIARVVEGLLAQGKRGGKTHLIPALPARRQQTR